MVSHVKTNLTIDQGSTFSNTIVLLDDNDELLDVTGYAANGQLRKNYASSNSVSFTMELSNGSLVYSLTANQTANIIAGRYVYDIKLTAANNYVSRIREGIVTITPQVTR